MKLADKKILVAGGTGFVGKHLINFLLSQKAKIICLTRQTIKPKNKNLEYIHLDLRKINQKNCEKITRKINKADFIVYLAAQIPSGSEKKEAMLKAKQNTLDPFINFLASFAHLSDNLIFTSTIDVYGIPGIIDFKESAPITPITPYAIAKFCCEKYLEYFYKKENKRYNILRLAQIYGPHEPLIKATPLIIKSIINNQEFILNGNGQDKRKFLYVDDAVSAIIQSMRTLKNGVFNIAGKEVVSILDIIKIAEKETNKKIKMEIINQDKKNINILPNCDKAEKELNFKPHYSFNDGIKKIIKNQSL